MQSVCLGSLDPAKRVARAQRLVSLAEAHGEVLAFDAGGFSGIRPAFPTFRVARDVAYEVVDLFASGGEGPRILEAPRRQGAPFFATVVWDAEGDQPERRRQVVWNQQGDVIGTISLQGPRLKPDDELDFESLGGRSRGEEIPTAANFFTRRLLADAMQI